MTQIHPGVWRLDDGRLATENLVPGVRVYDEDLLRAGPRELRTWNPQRSKLAAYLLKGGRTWPFDAKTRVLYLGAANGTTPSHVSDVAPTGLVYALEFSPRSFRDLLGVSAARANLVPILADAWRPETYEPMVGDVDVLYMDIAQRAQAEIFARNLRHFRPKVGMLMVKARSVDVTRDPRDVYQDVEQEVERVTSYRVVERVDLGPFEKDHAALVVLPEGQAPPRGAQAPQPRRDFDRGRGPPRERDRDARGPRRDDRRPRHGDFRGGGPRGRGPRKG